MNNKLDENVKTYSDNKIIFETLKSFRQAYKENWTQISEPETLGLLVSANIMLHFYKVVLFKNVEKEVVQKKLKKLCKRLTNIIMCASEEMAR